MPHFWLGTHKNIGLLRINGDQLGVSMDMHTLPEIQLRIAALGNKCIQQVRKLPIAQSNTAIFAWKMTVASSAKPEDTFTMNHSLESILVSNVWYKIVDNASITTNTVVTVWKVML